MKNDALCHKERLGSDMETAKALRELPWLFFLSSNHIVIAHAFMLSI